MQLEQTKMEKESKECTFTPEITYASRQIMKDKNSNPIYKRWQKEVENKKERINEALLIKAEKERVEVETWHNRPRKFQAEAKRHMYDSTYQWLEEKKQKIINAQMDKIALNNKIVHDFKPKLNKEFNEQVQMNKSKF